MKCPLMLKTWQSDGSHMKFEPMNCLEEECAWWDCILERCHLQSISLRLDSVWKELAAIKDKMPHEAQFWK